MRLTSVEFSKGPVDGAWVGLTTTGRPAATAFSSRLTREKKPAGAPVTTKDGGAREGVEPSWNVGPDGGGDCLYGG